MDTPKGGFESWYMVFFLKCVFILCYFVRYSLYIEVITKENPHS